MLSYGGRLRRFRLGLAALLAAAVPQAPVVAGAHTSGGGGQRQQLQSQLVQLDQAGAVALASLQGVQQQKDALDARAADLTSQLDAAQARLNPLADTAARLDASVAQLEATITVTQDRLDQARQAFDASAAQLYRSARSGSEYQTVLAAQPQDVVVESKFLALVSQQRKD